MKAAGIHVAPAVAERWWREQQEAGHDLEELRYACFEAARRGVRTLVYAAGILRNRARDRALARREAMEAGGDVESPTDGLIVLDDYRRTNGGAS